MAGPAKRPKKPAEGNSDSDSINEESDSDVYHGQEEVNIDFEGRNPQGEDFDGIRQLLKQVFRKAHIDLSEMSELLITQPVGSVLKQSYNDSDDDDDELDTSAENAVFGITSAINLTSYKENPCVQQLHSFIDEMSLKYADSTTQEKIKQIFNQSKNLGFLINERFVNISAKISPLMLNTLYEEIERTKQKDASYNFDFYVMICKIGKSKDNDDSVVLFSNDEEVIFFNEAEVSFEYSIADEAEADAGGMWSSEDSLIVPFRKILIFKADKFSNIISNVTALVE